MKKFSEFSFLTRLERRHYVAQKSIKNFFIHFHIYAQSSGKLKLIAFVILIIIKNHRKKVYFHGARVVLPLNYNTSYFKSGRLRMLQYFTN